MSLLSNISHEFTEDVMRKCKRDHEHQTIIGSTRGFGSRAIVSQVYPMPFCKAVAETVHRLLYAGDVAAPSMGDLVELGPGKYMTVPLNHMMTGISTLLPRRQRWARREWLNRGEYLTPTTAYQPNRCRQTHLLMVKPSGRTWLRKTMRCIDALMCSDKVGTGSWLALIC